MMSLTALPRAPAGAVRYRGEPRRRRADGDGAAGVGAGFAPKTFLVNFGRIVGNGVFAVTFATVGVQSVSTTITSNMGSPTVRGHFVSPANQFNVVIR
jgi:hypothetical protein